MMTSGEHADLLVKLVALRKRQIQSRFGPVPASISHLEELLSAATSYDDRVVLYALLASECSKARNDALYIDCLRRRARDLAGDPMAHAGLAITLSMIQPSNRSEVIEIAYKALRFAKAQDRLVRYCSTNMVRIGLMLDDYDTLQRGLSELVSDEGKERCEDSSYEFDFIDQIDADRCDTNLLAKYKALGRSSQKG